VLVIEDSSHTFENTLHVLRTKFLWHGACYEQFQVVNYGPVPVDLPFRLRFAADFADIFEVKGDSIVRRGHIITSWSADSTPRNYVL